MLFRSNTSSAADRAITIQPDAVVSSAKVAITAISPDTGSSSGDFITSAANLSVSGSNDILAAGEKIQVSADGSTWSDATVSGTTWTFDDTGNTRSGSFSYRARVININAIGNTASQLVTIDSTAPNAPVISGFEIDTGVRDDNITSDPTPTLAISAEVGASVTVLRNGVSVGAASETSRGNYS